MEKNAYGERYNNKLYNEFSCGQRTTTERCGGSGKEKTATDEQHKDAIRDLMEESRTFTTDQLADQTGISPTSVRRILTRLGYKKIGPHWLPHLLTDAQRTRRVQVCQAN